jgi:hypothetical protein
MQNDRFLLNHSLQHLTASIATKIFATPELNVIKQTRNYRRSKRLGGTHTKQKMADLMSEYSGIATEVTVGSIALLVWYYAIKPTTDKSEKRLAWILTLFSSLVCSFMSVPILINGFSNGWPPELFYGNDQLSQTLLRFFLVYLFWDSVLIAIEYPSIGGFHHHIPYALFMGGALWFKCPAVFVAFYPLEYSSLFLASGTIWPSCRQDIAFGVSFFLTRIVYHFVMWIHLYTTRESSPLLFWPFALLPLGVHVFWWYKWLLSQLKKRKKEKKDKIEDDKDK